MELKIILSKEEYLLIDNEMITLCQNEEKIGNCLIETVVSLMERHWEDQKKEQYLRGLK